MKHISLVALIFLANLLVAQTNIDSLEVLLPQKDGLEKVDLLNKLSNLYWNISPDKGLKYANEAYQLSLKSEDKSQVASALQNIGINYWAKSEYEHALTYYKKSFNLYETLNDLSGIASLCNNIAIVYDDLSDYENALKYHLKGLKISEKEGLVDLHTKMLGNISLVYLAQKNYQKALAYTQQAIESCKRHNDTKNLSAQVNNLGRIYDEQKDYIKARGFYKEALELNIKNKNNFGTTICLYNIGSTEHNLKNYDEALVYYKKSLLLSQEIDDKLGVLLAFKSIGLVNADQKKHTIALEYYKKSMSLAHELKAKEERLDILKDYYKLYKTVGNINQSLDYFEQYTSLKDSIFNEEKSRQLAEIQTKYESEKKEKENELLRKNNEIKDLEIEKQTNLRNSFIGISILILLFVVALFNRYNIKKRANQTLVEKNELINKQSKQLVLKNKELISQYEQLKMLNAMKDKFFKIISHDLKGPFSGILGLSGLLNKEYQSMDEPTRISSIQEINKASKTTYELLINLLTWARSQTGEIKISKERLNMKSLVDNSIRLYGLNASAKSIDFDIDIPEDIFITADKDTSQTFIGNLISNAIKFTPKGGLISIRCTDQSDTVKIHIIDTGVGIPPEVIEKLFRIDENITTVGTNKEIGTGLGLILCKEFVEKNEGQIDVKSEVGKGSEFIISLPK